MPKNGLKQNELVKNVDRKRPIADNQALQAGLRKCHDWALDKVEIQHATIHAWNLKAQDLDLMLRIPDEKEASEGS